MNKLESSILSEALMLRARANSTITPEEASLIVTAEKNGSLKILKGAGNVNIGYVIFANINKYSLLALLRNGILPRYFCEWSEGYICLIYRIFLLPDRSYEAIQQMKIFLRKQRAIVYIKKSKVIFLLRKNKHSYRNMTTHFLGSPVFPKRKAV